MPSLDVVVFLLCCSSPASKLQLVSCLCLAFLYNSQEVYFIVRLVHIIFVAKVPVVSDGWSMSLQSYYPLETSISFLRARNESTYFLLTHHTNGMVCIGGSNRTAAGLNGSDIVQTEPDHFAVLLRNRPKPSYWIWRQLFATNVFRHSGTFTKTRD